MLSEFLQKLMEWSVLSLELFGIVGIGYLVVTGITTIASKIKEKFA